MSDSQQSKKKMICLVLMGLIILAAVSVGMYFLYTKWYMKNQGSDDSAKANTLNVKANSLLGNQNGKNFCKKDEFISSELVNPFGSSAADKKKK